MVSPMSASRSATCAGRHAHEFLDRRGVVPGVVLGGVEHRDPVGDELEHVLVARDDDDVEALLLGAAGDGADDVVGLEAGVLEDGDAHGFEDAADVGNLVEEVGRRLGAVGFVLGELGDALGGFAALEDGGDVGGVVLLARASAACC